MQELVDLYNQLNGDYQHNKMILFSVDISYEKWAEILGLSYVTVARLLGSNGNPKEKWLVKMCLYLGYDRDICGKLLESFGRRLNPGDLQDKYVIDVFAKYDQWTYHQKIEYLKKAKYFS